MGIIFLISLVSISCISAITISSFGDFNDSSKMLNSNNTVNDSLDMFSNDGNISTVMENTINHNLSGEKGLFLLRTYMNLKFHYDPNGSSSIDDLNKTGKGNSIALAQFAQDKLLQNGYEVRIVSGETSDSLDHQWVQVKNNGHWENFESTAITRECGSKNYTQLLCTNKTVISINGTDVMPQTLENYFKSNKIENYTLPDDTGINMSNVSVENVTIQNVTMSNGSNLTYIILNNSSMNSSNYTPSVTNQSNYTDNDTITVTMYPSCANNCGDYKPYTKTYLNYCPFCHKWGTLSDTPKDPNRDGSGSSNGGAGVPEGEITCDPAKGGCDADFCGVCGADKMNPSRAYLVMVNGTGNTTVDGKTVNVGAPNGNVNISVSADIKEASNQICANCTTPEQKLRAIHHWVNHNVQYEYYGGTKKGAQGTFKAKAGNCCDQAQLVMAMANAQNITGRYVYCDSVSFLDGTSAHVWSQYNINGRWIDIDTVSTGSDKGYGSCAGHPNDAITILGSKLTF